MPARTNVGTSDISTPSDNNDPNPIMICLEVLKIILLSTFHLGKIQKPKVCGSGDKNPSQEGKPICPCHG